VAREDRRKWIDPEQIGLSVSRQCALAGLARSCYYYEPAEAENSENEALMRQIDRLYLRRPFYGSPRMTDWLGEYGWQVNVKRVARLMRVMGLQSVLPKPYTSWPHPENRVYPYLLRGLTIRAPKHVWCADITYIPLRQGHLYLVVVMDWFSRYVLAWELSNSMESEFCIQALNRALARGTPEIFNTDQGAQFSSAGFTDRLKAAGVAISMDGRGRALDNVFIERLWWSVKYEEVYPGDYANGWVANQRLGRYFQFYNTERKHQSLEKRTPCAVYFDQQPAAEEKSKQEEEATGRQATA
jgi:putative transposase